MSWEQEHHIHSVGKPMKISHFSQDLNFQTIYMEQRLIHNEMTMMTYLLSISAISMEGSRQTSFGSESINSNLTSSFFSFLASTLMIGELALRPLVLVVAAAFAAASEVAAASDLGLSLGEMELVLCK